MTLETDRLLLRPYRLSDAEAVHGYGSDPEVCRYTDFGPNTWGDTLAFLQDAVHPIPPKIEMGITLRGDDTVVGGVAAFPVAMGRWEMGWVLRRDLWGRGYATEATKAVFDAVAARGDVSMIAARCRPENAASARVMEKIGMRFLELIPRERKVRGEWVDARVYAALVPGANVPT